MKLKWIFVFFSLFLIGYSSVVFSEEQLPETIPAGLDFKTRKAIPRKLELEPYVGEYLGNQLNNSFALGGRIAYRLNHSFSLGLDLLYSRLQYDPLSSFGQSVQSRNQVLSLFTGMFAIPVLQRTGKTISEVDLFTTFGLGDNYINKKHRFTGMLGGGMKIYTKIPWLALRFDVSTYMYSLPRLTDSKFADDWVFSVGPSFLIFPKK